MTQLIQQVTADPVQKQTVVLPDGSSLTYVLRYRPIQQGWYFDALTWTGGWQTSGLRIVNIPNMLHQWKNLLTFGLGCTTAGNREPTQQQDFSSGASRLFILTAAEVAAYTAFLGAGPSGVS